MKTLLIYTVADDKKNFIILKNKLDMHQAGQVQLRHFDDGAQLLIWLTHRLDHSLPSLILLDLDMPVLNGYETLQLLKQAREFRSIPTIMLTRSNQVSIQRRCYELGCNAFITKSANGRQLLDAVNKLNTCLLTE